MIIKKRIIVISILLTAILLFLFIKGCIIPIVEDYNEHNLTTEEINDKGKLESDKYFRLFSKESQSELKLKNSYVTKSQHTFCSFNYEIFFRIIVFEVNLPEKNSYDKIVSLEKENFEKSRGVYSGYESDNMEFNYSTYHDSLVKNIWITYNGNLLDKTTIGDSIINYNLNASKLSFRFEKDGIRDVILSVKKKFSLLSLNTNMNILLYEKNSSLFIMVMYPREKNETIGSFAITNLLDFKK